MDLRILGPVELLDGGDRVRLGRAKERALLGVLALSSGRPVGVRVLRQALWDDQPPEQARKDLQIYVSRLRRYLRDGGSSAQIVTQRDTYCLSAGEESVDYVRFKSLLSAGRHAHREGNLDEAADFLYQGTALWNGPPIAELTTIWMEQRREELDSYDRLAGYQALCDVELERGNHRDVLQILDEVTDGHELDSKYVAQRLTALDGCGHYADFDAYWRQIFRRNVESFGTGPPRELQEFHSQLIQARDHFLPGARPAGRLAARPAQLPPLTSGFVGRRDQLIRLESVLARSRMSGPTAPLVVALTGPAGVGKTELALQWAHAIKKQFPDGQLHADLGGYAATDPADPGAVIGDLLAALGVAPESVPDTLTARAALLRTVLDDKRLLIVLDNVRDSGQVRPLLPASVHCVLIVTSRHRLTDLVTRNGACRVPVPPLPPAETAALLRHVLEGAEAQPTETVVDELVAIAGGLPQAVRTVAELAGGDRPARPGEVLCAGEDESATIGASLGWSCRALPESAARLYRLLGAHPAADLSRPAAAALAETTPEQTGRDLAVLANLNLVELAADRVRLHPLVHAHAVDTLADTERDEACRRMLDWYLRMLDGAEATLPFTSSAAPEQGFHDPPEALGWLAAERVNLAMAVELAAERGWPHAWWLLRSLRPYIAREDPPGDWVDVHTTTLAATRRAGDREGEAVALLGLALAYRRTGAKEVELECLRGVLRVYRAMGDQRGESEALRMIAESYENRGDFGPALEFSAEALAVHAEIDAPNLRASAHYQLGVMHAHRDEPAEALRNLTEAAAVYRAEGDRTGLLRALTRLGMLARGQGRDEEAFGLLKDAVELSGAQRAHALPALVHLSELSCATGRFGVARRYALEAVGLCHPTQDFQPMVRALVSLVRALHALGRRAEAEREAGKVVELVADTHDPVAVAAVRQLGLLGLPVRGSP